MVTVEVNTELLVAVNLWPPVFFQDYAPARSELLVMTLTATGKNHNLSRNQLLKL